MRPHHLIAIAVVILIGFGARPLFFPTPTADADASAVTGMNVHQMHVDYPNMKDLAEQKMRDMTFVFSPGD